MSWWCCMAFTPADPLPWVPTLSSTCLAMLLILGSTAKPQVGISNFPKLSLSLSQTCQCQYPQDVKKIREQKNTNIHKKNPCAKSTQTKTIPRPIAFLKWFSSPCPQLLSWLEQTNSSSCPQRWSPGYGSIGQDSPCAWGHLESVCRYQSEEITRRCYLTGGICTWTVQCPSSIGCTSHLHPW